MNINFPNEIRNEIWWNVVLKNQLQTVKGLIKWNLVEYLLFTSIFVIDKLHLLFYRMVYVLSKYDTGLVTEFPCQSDSINKTNRRE